MNETKRILAVLIFAYLSIGSALSQKFPANSNDGWFNPSCDTLHFPLTGTPTLYSVSSPGSGYVCGNNSYGDLAKADYFAPDSIGRRVYKAFFDFALAVNESGQNPDIDFKIWDTQGSDSLPGNVLGTASKSLSSIISDIQAGYMTEVNFNPPVEVNAPFFLGVILPIDEGDTLALISNLDGEVDPGISYEQWSEGEWYPVNSGSSWGLNLMQSIFAIYCDVGYNIPTHSRALSFRVFPNPANNLVNITLEQVAWESIALIKVFSTSGQVLDVFEVPDGNQSIQLNITGYPAGLYYISVLSETIIITKKLLVY